MRTAISANSPGWRVRKPAASSGVTRSAGSVTVPMALDLVHDQDLEPAPCREMLRLAVAVGDDEPGPVGARGIDVRAPPVVAHQGRRADAAHRPPGVNDDRS